MFKDFSDAVRNQFDEMSKGELFVMDIDKDVVWNHYLDAFPDGTNEVFKERREYDCNHCSQFIKRIGNVVSIVDNKIITVWDIDTSKLDDEYKVVAGEMSAFVRMSSTIRTKFLFNEKKIGTPSNKQLLENGNVKTWYHFSCEIPNRFISDDYNSKLSDINATKQVFERGLNEITDESIEIVLELIDQNSIYRGDEFKNTIKEFAKIKNEYSKFQTPTAKSIYMWSKMDNPSSRIRNSVIGTLLTDISDGVDLTESVKKFESKVAPTNYKRTSSLITKGMIDSAMKTIKELDIESALQRRYAKLDDVSVNNVLFVDRSVSPLMKDSLEDLLMTEIKPNTKKFDDVQDVSINEFVKDILPKITSMEILVKNNLTPNFMSLIAPNDPNSKNILKWNNNFSWSYNGEITDSMKENVKKAGGDVEGDLRFSIQWNDNDDNHNDLDAHCQEPSGGNHISFRNMRSIATKGTLDVDITDPKGVAVENIIYKNKNDMIDGVYEFSVHNYTERGGKNFSAEIEFDGKIFKFRYEKKMRGNETVIVAKVKYTKADGFSLVESLPHSEESKQVWNVATEQFQKVSSMMLSPNFWDEQTIGNKHWFFLLDGCINPDKTRGLYNEFLDNSLTKHRKVFEVLSAKMKCDNSEEQLSGLGFSSTQRNEIICKVDGNFTRTLKIKF